MRKLWKVEKALIAYAKKWMMSDDYMKTTVEGEEVFLDMKMNDNNDMILTYTDMFEVDYHWMFSQVTNKWYNLNLKKVI